MMLSQKLFNLDPLAMVLSGLVIFIAATVTSFASRYMKGDAHYRRFFCLLVLLVISVLVMVAANNLILLLASWAFSNVLLVELIIHKKGWKAARESGKLALQTLAIGLVAMTLSFILLYHVYDSVTISVIIEHTSQSFLLIPALLLLLLSAMAQSGIWPFHKWLISSLNSPTPISAMMHAGLINGGGFLLARFAPLYLQHSTLLILIFCIGLTTALLGTLWKLMQNDIKRMLACSTVGQMGFMMAQVGLGLFPAAVAHLCWHGTFKAYLFLNSSHAVQEKRFELAHPPTALGFILALACGICASYAFAYAGGKSWLSTDTTLLLIIVSCIAGTQLAISILRDTPLKRLPIAFVISGIAGLVYGCSVHLAESFLAGTVSMQPQPLNIVYIGGIATLCFAWLLMLFGRQIEQRIASHDWLLSLYVKALNASQPHPKTVTADRNTYKFLGNKS